MHDAAYLALGMPHSYDALRTTKEELPGRIVALRDGTYDGFNVTVPHKQAVLEWVDDIEPSAVRVSAANTLVVEDGKLVALNTDVPALAGELVALAPARTPEEWAAGSALVLGSGGAARAAVAALDSLGVRDIVVRARSAEMLTSLSRAAGSAKVSFERLERGAGEGRFHTVVQATSLGMSGAGPGETVAQSVDFAALPKHAIVLDVVYAPLETQFLAEARAHGLAAANGLGMLARQGALSFARWLGVEPPLEVMLAALR